MEIIEASTSNEGMNTPATKVPAGTQTSPLLRRKVPDQKKAGATEGPTVITRSMQKKIDMNPPKPIKPHPSLSDLSGLLVHAIGSCRTENGLNYPELKKILKGQGYDVIKGCPRIKKKLHTLASKSALVHMTNSDGSMLFVIRKYPEKASTSRIFEGSKQMDETKQEGAERRKSASNSAKAKGATRQAKGSGWKPGEDSSGRLQSPDKKLKTGEKQPRQPTSRSGSAKESQDNVKKVISTTKSQHQSSGNREVSTPQSPCHSSENTAATPKRTMNTRSRTGSAAKKLASSVSLIPTRSRLSEYNIKRSASVKMLGSPYSKESLSGKKLKQCKSKTALPSEGQRQLKKKSSRSLQDCSSTAVSRVLKTKRRS